MTTEAINWLYCSLPKRETPEAVAARVCDALGAAAPSEARRIARAGTKQRFGWSSMSNRFRGADPMDRQIAKARELAQAFLDRDLPGADDIAGWRARGLGESDSFETQAPFGFAVFHDMCRLAREHRLPMKLHY